MCRFSTSLRIYAVICCMLQPFLSHAQLEVSADYGRNNLPGFEAKGALGYTFFNTIKIGVGYEVTRVVKDQTNIGDPARYPYLFGDVVHRFGKSRIYAGASYGTYSYDNTNAGMHVAVDELSKYKVKATTFTLGYAHNITKRFSVTATGNYHIMNIVNDVTLFPSTYWHIHSDIHYWSGTAGVQYSLFFKKARKVLKP